MFGYPLWTTVMENVFCHTFPLRSLHTRVIMLRVFFIVIVFLGGGLNIFQMLHKSCTITVTNQLIYLIIVKIIGINTHTLELILCRLIVYTCHQLDKLFLNSTFAFVCSNKELQRLLFGRTCHVSNSSLLAAAWCFYSCSDTFRKGVFAVLL